MIGLVGGIGSGKSSLARELQKKYRVEIVDGDRAGHDVLKEEPVKNEIRARFGDGVFDAGGEIDRRRMSELVFGDSPARQEARRALESIVHPRITEKLSRQIAAARSNPELDFIVLDAALLLEAGWRTMCDHVIYIDTPEELRRARVFETRRWSAQQLHDREASQFPLDRKRREAHSIVRNDHHTDHALSQFDSILSRFVTPGTRR